MDKTYILVKKIPDGNGRVANIETVLVMSKDEEALKKYCKTEYDFTIGEKVGGWATFYVIEESKIKIV